MKPSQDLTVPEIPESYWDNNPVAQFVKAGKRVTVLVLKGDNSDYVRMNGMGWPGFVYGVTFRGLNRTDEEGNYEKENLAAAQMHGLLRGSLGQHRPDAIALHVCNKGETKLTVYELSHGAPPGMYDILPDPPG
jgi:hypothetical protein